MIKLTIGDKDYLHPNKISEVNLKQWIDLKSVQNDESLTPLENNLKGFSEFSGIPMKALLSAPKKEVMFYISQVINMLSEVDVDKEMIDSFKVGRTTYYVNKDIDSAPTAQYIDCTHKMNQMNSEPCFYPYMMAIYCLKKNEKYDKVDLKKRVKIMHKAKVVDAIKVNTFFLITSQSYREDFLLYLGESQTKSKCKPEAGT